MFYEMLPTSELQGSLVVDPASGSTVGGGDDD